jgi:SAM-dependent methyltransferase
MRPVEAPWFRSPLFGLVAPSLGWAPPIRYLLRRERIRRLLGSLPPHRLLEVGCGAGALLDEFAASGHDATGLETSPRAIAMARAIAAATGQGQTLTSEPSPSWGGAFDLVCAFDVLEHVADDQAAIATWLQWLKPGGQLCLSVPAHRSRWGAGDEWAGHHRRYDRRDLLALLADNRLQVEHLECYGFPLANLTEWLGERTYRRLIRQRESEFSSAQASAESGVERADYVRMFRRMDTVPGRLALRVNFALQSLAARTDLGSGYLVMARRA